MPNVHETLLTEPSDLLDGICSGLKRPGMVGKQYEQKIALAKNAYSTGVQGFDKLLASPPKSVAPAHTLFREGRKFHGAGSAGCIRGTQGLRSEELFFVLEGLSNSGSSAARSPCSQKSYARRLPSARAMMARCC